MQHYNENLRKKILNFYCIYKHGDIRSEELLDNCIESGKKFNYEIFPFKGVYGDEIDKQVVTLNLYKNKSGIRKMQSRGVVGCFISHFLLWKKCFEINKPLGVLEYDAEFINSLPENFLELFEDYLNLDFTRHCYYNKDINLYREKLTVQQHGVDIKQLSETAVTSGKNSFKYINNNHIKGAFGYVIKPSGAEKLIRATEEFGMLPADIQPNLKYCQLYYANPSIVRLSEKSLLNKHSHTKKER